MKKIRHDDIIVIVPSLSITQIAHLKENILATIAPRQQEARNMTLNNSTERQILSLY